MSAAKAYALLKCLLSMKQRGYTPIPATQVSSTCRWFSSYDFFVLMMH